MVARQTNDQPSTIGERLLFVIWLSAKVLGAESSKDFAALIGKGGSQLSRWVKEDPRPGWGSIKTVADAVGVDPLWLDDPARDTAREPPDFPEWIAARRAKQARKTRKRA